MGRAEAMDHGAGDPPFWPWLPLPQPVPIRPGRRNR